MKQVSRRDAVLMEVSAALYLTVTDAAFATPAEAEAEIDKFTGGKEPAQGKITIDLPEIAENGNTVPLNITVDAPMTAESYVSDVLVVADGNPSPGDRQVSFHAVVGSRGGGNAYSAGGDRERDRRRKDQRRPDLHRSQAGQGHDRRLRRMTKSE